MELWELCRSINVKELEHLLKNNNYSNKKINEAFKRSVEINRLDLVKVLIDYGADVNYQHNIPFYSCAQEGYIEIMTLLIDKGVNIHTDDGYALITAAENGQLEVVKLLLENGMDLNYNGGEVFESALCNNQFEILDYLIDNGFNIDILNSYVYHNLLDKLPVSKNICLEYNSVYISIKKLSVYMNKYINLLPYDIKIYRIQYLHKVITIQRYVLQWLWKPRDKNNKSGLMFLKAENNWKENLLLQNF